MKYSSCVNPDKLDVFSKNLSYFKLSQNDLFYFHKNRVEVWRIFLKK